MFAKRVIALTGVILLTGLALACPATAQMQWQYRAFSGPDSGTFYQPNDINNNGAIAGNYRGNLGKASGGFVMQDGNFTQFGSANTSLSKTNNNGASVGDQVSADGNSDVAFVRASNGVITNLPTQSSNDAALGVNDGGRVVGYSVNDSFDTVHGIIWNGGTAAAFDYPGSSDTSLWGVNNAGKIVGNTDAILGNAKFMGFVLDRGVATPLSVPGAVAVFAADINNHDQILGHYATADGNGHGCIFTNGIVTTLDFGGIDAYFGTTYTDGSGDVFTRTGTFTSPSGFNDAGDFVGIFGAFYADKNGRFLGAQRGFAATAVPEPGALALLTGIAGVGMLALRHRKQERKMNIKTLCKSLPPVFFTLMGSSQGAQSQDLYVSSNKTVANGNPINGIYATVRVGRDSLLNNYNGIHADVTGGTYSGAFFAYNTSTVNVTGGVFNQSLLPQGATVMNFGGTAQAKNFLSIFNTGTLNVTGGTINTLQNTDAALCNFGGTAQASVLFTFGVSTTNVTGGAFSSDGLVKESSTVNVKGGAFNGGLDAYDTSTINVTGGTIKAGLSAHAHSVVNISGAPDIAYFQIADYSTINIRGATLAADLVATNNATVNVSGGSIVSFVETDNNSLLNFSGTARADTIVAVDTSVITISGGVMTSLFGDGGTFNISGGQIASDLANLASSVFNLSGVGLTLSHAMRGTFNDGFGGLYEGVFWNLKGTLQNGDALNTRYFDYQGSLSAPANINGATVIAPTAQIVGTLRLEGIAATAAAQNITFTLRPSDASGDLMQIMSVSASGAFSLSSVPRKNYIVHIKGDKYLAVNVNVDATGGDVSGVTATLPAGDANNDNSVDSTDFGLLIGAFNTSATLPGNGYDPACDFNFDGSVDSTDFGLLIGNYGQSGAL